MWRLIRLKYCRSENFPNYLVTRCRLSKEFNCPFNAQGWQKKIYYHMHCVQLLFNGIQAVGENCPLLPNGNIPCKQINLCQLYRTLTLQLQYERQPRLNVSFCLPSEWICTTRRNWQLHSARSCEFTTLNHNGCFTMGKMCTLLVKKKSELSSARR
jgi:hypothetical protein